MRKLKILILEDNELDAELIKEELTQHKLEFVYKQVETQSDFTNALLDFKPEVILSDYNLPQFTGYDALKIAKELSPEVPFILVTGNLSEEIAIQSIKSGVWDYILKDNLLRLVPAIESALSLKVEKDKNEVVQKELVKLSTAVSQSPISVVITNVKGDIEYVNPKFTEITGYSFREIFGKNPRILNSGLQPKQIYTEMWKTIKSGKVWEGELRNKTKTGELFWERITITPIKNGEGEIINYLGLKENITTEVEANKNLRRTYEKLEVRNKELMALSEELSEKNRLLLESENRFRDLFDKSPIPIWEEDFSEVIKLLNKKKSETQDLKTYLDENPQFLKKCIANIKILRVSEVTYDIFGVKNLPELVELLRRANTQKTYRALKEEFLFLTSNENEFAGETEFRIDNGEMITLIIKSVIDDKGIAVVSLNDISALKKAEQTLKESERSFRELYEKSGDAILILKNGKFIACNLATVKMLKYKKKELFLNLHPSEISPEIQPDGASSFTEAEKMIELSLKKGTHRFEWIHAKSDGELFPVEVLLTVISTESKNQIIHCVLRDITERKKTELELIKSKEKAEESNRLKTEFLHNMSHEIRTPMNGILGFTQLLDDAYLTDEKRTHYVNIIQNSGKELLHIIDDILEISRLETKQVSIVESEVCINDTFFELFSIFNIKAKEKGVSLYFKKGLLDTESTIYTDKVKLNKILSNLLENALKFTTRGYVAFGYDLNKNNTSLEIYVKDTGIGIELGKQKNIFDRFSQAEKKISRKAGGLGLGLSIAKENAELLGGNISVESEIRDGAKFIITIPYKPVKTKSKVKAENGCIQDGIEGCTILVAEDEEVNFLFLEILLLDKLKLSCKILHAIDGEEAVKMCKENSNIDFVLMDIKMPKMNGYEATKEIKKIRPNLPIVAQTAYSTREDMEKAKAAGCIDFISKPIDKNILNDVIKKYMKKQRTE